MLFPAKYYVSTTGIITNPGTISQPWPIVHSFSTALAGDTVYVKAGNYGAVNLVIKNNNTTFIGYTSTPGDLSSLNQPDSLNTYLANNYITIYPTINKLNRVSGGTGIEFNTWLTGVKVKNFHILNYVIGVSVVGRQNSTENIIVNGIGDVLNSYSGTGIVAFGHRNNIDKCLVINSAAEGICIKGDSNSVNYSKVYATDTSSVYSLTDYYIYIAPNSGTKYARGNKIDNCYLERRGYADPSKGHQGHGLCITMSYNHSVCATGVCGTLTASPLYCYDPTQKLQSATSNSITNSTVKNIYETVMLRGDGVRYNYIENVTSYSYGGLTIQNSCRYNTFNRCKIKNTYYWKDPFSSSISRFAGVNLGASYFGDSIAVNICGMETNSYPWEVTYGSSFNYFRNCIFENVACGINLENYSEFVYPSYHPLAGQAIDRINRKRIVGNEFINCTFVGRNDTVDIFFKATRGNTQNKLVNCIVTGFKNYESRSFTANTTTAVVALHGIIPTNFTYQNCLFYNNGFDASIPTNGTVAPIGLGPLVQGFSNAVAGTFSNCLVNINPQFVNSTIMNFHLLPASPCINSGTFVTLNNDYDNNTRPCGAGFDIGAYEYQNCSVLVENINGTGRPLTVRPNPSNGYLTLNAEGQISHIKIYSIEGRLLNTSDEQGSEVKLDLSDFESGIYLIQCQIKEKLTTAKVVLYK